MYETPRGLSFEAYLALEAEADVKHEYDDGALVAMTGATDAHVTITGNLQAEIRAHVRGGPCRVYSTDMKVRPIRAKGYYPDVFVSCDERDRADRLVKRYPSLVIEVLSDSTERRDRGSKWLAYRRCETLHEYVLVAQDQQLVELYRRAGDIWTYQVYSAGDEVLLASIDLRLSMESIYEGVGDLQEEAMAQPDETI